MQTLPITLQYDFDLLLGYDGGQRWFAFWWSQTTEGAIVTDGDYSNPGREAGYEQFVNEYKDKLSGEGDLVDRIEEQEDVRMGDEETDPDNIFIADMASQKLYIGERDELREHLRQLNKQVADKA